MLATHLRPLPTSLAGMLDDDLLEQALTRPATRPVQPQVPFIPQWRSEGYVARIQSLKCKCCKAVADFPLGIFHKESTVSGARTVRYQKAAQWPMDDLQLESEPTQVDFCADCLLGLVTGRSL